MASTLNAPISKTVNVISAEELLLRWQRNRRLTRRVIDAFPEDKLFHFSVGGMRPFSVLAIEFLKMEVPVVEGVATGKWGSKWDGGPAPETKAELLKLWDEATDEINDAWSKIPADRFAEKDKAFGMWEDTGINIILYAFENEIHHRGQGYVYLRALGIEPPAFYDPS